MNDLLTQLVVARAMSIASGGFSYRRVALDVVE
jgi:hypothetical protein